jgi:hypothetical protein
MVEVKEINFGNGNGDIVSITDSGTAVGGNKISFGNGNNDSVKTGSDITGAGISGNSITFGNGAGDNVTATRKTTQFTSAMATATI